MSSSNGSTNGATATAGGIGAATAGGGATAGAGAGTHPSATQHYQGSNGNNVNGNGNHANGVSAVVVHANAVSGNNPPSRINPPSGNNPPSGGHSASLYATTSISTSASSSSSSVQISRASASVSVHPSISSSSSSTDVLDDDALMAMDLDIDSLLLKRRDIAVHITATTSNSNNDNNNTARMTTTSSTATTAAVVATTTTSAANSTTNSMGVSSSSSYSQHLLHPSPPESEMHASGPGLGPGSAPMQSSTNGILNNHGAMNHPIIANKENFSQNSLDVHRSQGVGTTGAVVLGNGNGNGVFIAGGSMDALSSRGPMMMASEDRRDEQKLAGSKRPLVGGENDWYISGDSASKDSGDVERSGIHVAAGTGVGGSTTGATTGITAGIASQEGNKRQATASSRGMNTNVTMGYHSMNISHSSSGDGGGSSVAMGLQMLPSSTHEIQHTRTHQSSSSSLPSPPPLPSPPLPTVTCIRLIVLDITDDPQRRIKDLTCTFADNATTTTSQSQQQQQPQHPSAMNSARVVSSNMVVRVTGDWYHASIRGGHPLSFYHPIHLTLSLTLSPSLILST